MQNIQEQEAYKELQRRHKSAMLQLTQVNDILWMICDGSYSEEFKADIAKQVKGHVEKGILALAGKP